MNALLFDHAQWERFYNCNAYNYDWIPLEERRSVGSAILALCIAIPVLMLYVPCLVAIRSSPELYRESCYRIMFFGGCVDVSVMSIVFWHAFYSFRGEVFCKSPVPMFLMGVNGSTSYYLEQACDCLLAFNRLVHMKNEDWAKALFDGKRLYFWFMLISIIPTYLAFYSPPYVPNAVLNSWDQNPHTGYLGQVPGLERFIADLDPESRAFYYTPGHQIYSCTIVSTLVLIYTMFLFIFIARRKLANTHSSIADRKVFFQVFWISVCCASVSVAIAYSTYLFKSFPWLKPVTTYGYYFYQGSPCYIYLTMNAAIQKRVFGYFRTGVHGVTSRMGIWSLTQETLPDNNRVAPQSYFPSRV